MTGVHRAVDCGTLMTFREHPMTGQATMAPVELPDDGIGDDLTVLVKHAAAGDQAAWDALVARDTNLLWSVARGYRLERSDAADVVQVAWLRLVEHLPRVRDPERVGAWLATTVRRECLQVIARRRRGTPVDDEILTGCRTTLRRSTRRCSPRSRRPSCGRRSRRSRRAARSCSAC